MLLLPPLPRTAFKRTRLVELYTHDVDLPGLVGFDAVGLEARRNAYGRFPEDINKDELAFAQLLDADSSVSWWHRNPIRNPSSVALFGWDNGAGFYPDFVVSVEGRKAQDNIVLVEVKDPQLWSVPSEVMKITGSRHPNYGHVVAVGRRADESFKRLEPEDNRLTPIGDFDSAQLRLAKI